jgi:hypothetical protein
MIVTTPAASLLNRSLTFYAKTAPTEQGRAKFGDHGIVLENLKDSDIVEGRHGSVVVRVVGQKIYFEAVE